MKKILKFAFAVVAMASVVFASASCGKDDDMSHITKDMWYNEHIEGDPVREPGFEKPKIKEVGYGENFYLAWTPASYIDTTQFEYEVRWLKDRYEVNAPYYSSGRIKDTIYRFSEEQKKQMKEMEPFVIQVYAYYWYKKERRVGTFIEDHCFWRKDYEFDIYRPIELTDNHLKINIDKFYLGNMFDRIVITLCDVKDGKVVKEYATEDYLPDPNDKTNLIDFDNIEDGWSHNVRFTLYKKGNFVYEFINNMDEYNNNKDLI